MAENIKIASIEITKDIHPLKKGLHIDFNKSVCFLVGDNGVGKSTIMDCLADKFKFKDDTYMKRNKMKHNIKVEYANDFLVYEELDSKPPVNYMDFHASDRRFSGSFGDDMMMQIGQMKASSGQVTIGLLNRILKNIKKYENGVIILDEPCRGMSIRNQIMVANLIKGMSEKVGCQVIVTSHSVVILGKFEKTAQYFNVGLGKEVTYDEYFKEQCIMK